MSLSENGGGMSAADMAAVMGANGNGNYGWGDGSFWIIVLFLFALMGNGWGNGFGGANNGTTYVANDVQRGFDQQAVMTSLNGIANTQNSLAMSMQNCCCENRAGIADLKYTVATENCADRTTMQQGFQMLSNTIGDKVQVVMDKLCQLELDNYKQRNADLLAENNALKFAQSQSEQTAQILANNAAQTSALEQYLNPAPIPAYVVQNPNCCANGIYNGCGCNA